MFQLNCFLASKLYFVVQSQSCVWLLQTHGLQHSRLPCTSLSFRVCSNSCPLNQWCHPTISSSADLFSMGFPDVSYGKESSHNVGDPGSVPGLGRSPGERNGYTLQYSCLENSMDGGAWQATAHGIAESDTTEWLRTHTWKYEGTIKILSRKTWKLPNRGHWSHTTATAVKGFSVESFHFLCVMRVWVIFKLHFFPLKVILSFQLLPISQRNNLIFYLTVGSPINK